MGKVRKHPSSLQQQQAQGRRTCSMGTPGRRINRSKHLERCLALRSLRATACANPAWADFGPARLKAEPFCTLSIPCPKLPFSLMRLSLAVLLRLCFILHSACMHSLQQPPPSPHPPPPPPPPNVCRMTIYLSSYEDRFSDCNDCRTSDLYTCDPQINCSIMTFGKLMVLVKGALTRTHECKSCMPLACCLPAVTFRHSYTHTGPVSCAGSLHT